MTDFAHMFETYSYCILCFFLIDNERQMENTEESNMRKIQTRDSLLSAEGHTHRCVFRVSPLLPLICFEWVDVMQR